jgi:FkbH-like protein
MLGEHRDEVLDGWLRNHRAASFVQPRLERHGVAAYRDTYLRPLLDLLVGYVATGEEAYADVYVDERGRLVPSDAEAREELATLLEADAGVLLGALDGAAPLLAPALERLHGALLAPTEGEAVDLALVGDCLMTELRAFLAPAARADGIALRSEHVYFSAGLGKPLDAGRVVQLAQSGGPDLMAFSFFTYEGIPPYTALLAEAHRLAGAEIDARAQALADLARGCLEEVRATTRAPFLVHGVCGLPLRRRRRLLRPLPPMDRSRRRVVEALNGALREAVEQLENAIWIDERAVVARHGARHCDSPVLPAEITRGALFHTSWLGRHLAAEYAPVVRAYARLGAIKVLLVDLDDTLWRGVMAEGRVVHDERAQRLLRDLREAGLLLVALSKNDPAAIRWEELLLDREDFVLHKVSWNPKVQSVEETAQQLDLDPRSFALIDDNPVERELVHQRFPEIAALDPAQPETWDALAWMLEFPNTRRTEEARRRTAMYREAAARREAMAGEIDLTAMMASLDLRSELGAPRPGELDRVAELVARTNQFNTTTRRYTPGQLGSLADDPGHGLYVATLADKFGDLGIVGVVVTERNGEELVFESVVMSCRAMGYGLEDLLLRTVLDRERGWTRAVGLYRRTERNDPCARLFEEAGFAQRDEESWILEAGAGLPAAPAWIALTLRDDEPASRA